MFTVERTPAASEKKTFFSTSCIVALAMIRKLYRMIIMCSSLSKVTKACGAIH